MTKRRKRCHIGMFLLFMVWISWSLAAGAEEKENTAIPVYFFHNTACGTCDGTEEFDTLVEEQISGYKKACPYEILEYNVFKTGGKKEWDAIAEKYELKNEHYIFPVMVIDGEMYTGMSAIREHLHTAFLKSAGISAVYFYREDCPECLNMETFWEQLPGTFESNGAEYSCNLLKLESRTDTNGKLIRKLFEIYQVPDEDQMVPIVFLKDRYLAGQQKIEEHLLQWLEEGSGFLSEKEETGESGDETMVSESGEMLE